MNHESATFQLVEEVYRYAPRISLVRELLAKGADPCCCQVPWDVNDPINELELGLVEDFPREEMIDILKGRVKPLLHRAIETGHLGLVEALCRHGAFRQINQDISGTAVHWAALYGRARILNLLLSLGGNANAGTSSFDCHPVHLAAECGNVSTIHVLLEDGVHVDVLDSAMETPLLKAVRAGHIDAASYLLGKGANVNYRNNLDVGALDEALRLRNFGMLRLLREYGAPVNISVLKGLEVVRKLRVNP